MSSKPRRGRVYGEIVDPATGELIRRLDKDGRELPYGDPVGIPVGMSQVDDTLATVRRLVHSEMLKARADAEGFDSPEEADDFDLPDDPLDPLTPYEEHFMPPPVQQEVKDGSRSVDEGRVADGGARPGKSRAVGKDQSKPVKDAADTGDLPETAGDDAVADK